MESTTAENEKRLLAATVRERLIGKKNQILYIELLNKKIPTFLNNYLQNSVQKIIHTEEPIQFNNSKRFDFEYKKINEIKNSLIKAIEEATIFTKDELTEIINKTVRLQFDLLVKPGKTLLKIFYRNRSDRIQNEILQILTGLNDDRLFIKKLVFNIQEFDQYHIVEDDFKNILNKTEKEVYNTDFFSAFNSDVVSFIDFLNIIHGHNIKELSVELVKLLLFERKKKEYLPIFDNITESLNIEKINSLLTDFIKNQKEIDYSDLEDDEIKDFIVVPSTDQDQLEEDSKKIFPKITNIGKDPMDMIISRSKIEQQPDGPIKALQPLIDEKNKKFLTKKIFENDCQAYDEFINQLEDIDNWKTAKKMIDKELVIRSVQPFSKEALCLGDIVFNRYFPKKN